MKLHLPKALFAAVVAALTCVQQADAATYYLNAGAGDGVKISTSFRTESGGSTSVAWEKFCSKQTANYDGPHQLVIDQTRAENNKVKIDFAPFNVTGFTVTAAGNYLYREATDDSIIIGNAAEGAGTQSSSFSESFTLELQGNKNGVIELVGTQTWDITSGKNVNLIGTVKNTGTTTINGGTISVAGTLTNNGSLSFGENTILAISNAIAGSTGSLNFGSNTKIVLTGLEGVRALEHNTFGFVSTKADVFTDTISLSDSSSTVTVEYDGNSYTANSMGIVDGLSLEQSEDSTYYIRGAAKASDILAANDDITGSSAVKMDKSYSALTVDADITLPRLQATLGEISLTEDLTVTGASSITGTIVEGTGELIVAEGATLQVNNIAKNLKSNIRINSGATMSFLGTGQDAIDYDQTERAIYVDGTMNVGTTRQTVGNWNFELTGGIIEGNGQSTQSSVGLDFHASGKITAKALADATSDSLTKSTISTKVRYKGTLTLEVEENARLDVTGGMVNNGNAGTLNITLGKKGELNIRQSDGSTTTLGTVTLNGGGFFKQGSNGKYTTNITTLTVGADGGILGTSHDSNYGANSWETLLNIGTLTGTGDLIAMSNSNTSNATTIRINGGTGYSGTVKVQNWAATDKTRRTDLDVASDTALANAVIELGGGTNDSSSHTTNLVLGASAVSVKGIQDGAGRKSSGAVIVRPPANANTSVVPSTLTINTNGNDYSTKSGVKEAISLVKTGEGTQSFNGDMSFFNSAITVNAGTLEFLKESTSLNVSQLTVTGGKLKANGSVNTSDTLTYSAGTIDANLNVQTGTTLTLNGTVTMSEGTLTLGDSLTLNGSKLSEILALTEGNRVDLFSGVGALPLNGQTYTMGSNILDATSNIDLGTYFTLADAATPTTYSDSVIASGYYLGYDATGTVYAGKLIPEPTTTTLSLLALAALAARRRRR